MEDETKTTRKDQNQFFYFFVFFLKIQDIRKPKHQFLKGDSRKFIWVQF